MQRVYLSENAYPEVFAYLAKIGREAVGVPFDARLGSFTGDHADLRLIKIGGRVLFAAESDYKPDYPGNAAFCALCFGNFFVHRLDISAPMLLNEAKRLGLVTVNVRQGYARCSACPVDWRSVITSDAGMADAMERAGVEVLRIRPGFVSLPGYPEGFFGGTAGRVGDELIVNGDLARHPDCELIRDFCRRRGVAVRDFPGLPLRDIGSVIG